MEQRDTRAHDTRPGLALDDRRVFVGTPNDTTLWRGVEDGRDAGSPQWQPVVGEGQTVRFAASPEGCANPPGPWNEPRLLYLQHASDPVVWWYWSILRSRPDWLAEPRGPDVNTNSIWFPWVSFWQVTVDQFHGTGVPNGHGHNYGNMMVSAWGRSSVRRRAGRTPTPPACSSASMRTPSSSAAGAHWTRDFFRDTTIVGASTAEALYTVLLRIPFGTALSEELIFRGALLGLYLQRHRPWVAALLSSLVFGVWHVLPTLSSLDTNPGASATQDSVLLQAGAVAFVVVATAVAGMFFSWLRLRSGSILAPWLTHTGFNAAGYLGSRLEGLLPR